MSIVSHLVSQSRLELDSCYNYFYSERSWSYIYIVYRFHCWPYMLLRTQIHNVIEWFNTTTTTLSLSLSREVNTSPTPTAPINTSFSGRPAHRPSKLFFPGKALPIYLSLPFSQWSENRSPTVYSQMEEVRARAYTDPQIKKGDKEQCWTARNSSVDAWTLGGETLDSGLWAHI